MKALVIQHSPDTGIGLVGPVLQKRHGFELTTVDSKTVDFDKIDPADSDLVVLLGSPRGVYEQHVPWIAAELQFTKHLLAIRKPVFGICFGAQMLAEAMGSPVRPMGVRHQGWVTNDFAVDDVWAGPWFLWHGDTFALPAGARLLANHGAVTQGFQLGNAVGVQFHPEVDNAIIRCWLNGSDADSCGNGAEPASDPFKTEAEMRAVERKLEALMDDVLARCVG